MKSPKFARGRTPSTAGCTVRVRRQDAPDDAASRRFERFFVEVGPRTTIADVLAAIDRRPVTADGREVSPLAWEGGCLEGSCGACTVRVDGVARVACTTRIRSLKIKRNTVTLEPLSKFPVVRDLVVDRSRIFADLAAARVWLDGAPPMGESSGGDAPRLSERTARAVDAGCTTCGACLDACPEYGENRPFFGAAVIFASERARKSAGKRGGAHLEVLLGEGGIANCGGSGNCAEVCPVGIPLVEMLREAASATTAHFFGWLVREDR